MSKDRTISDELRQFAENLRDIAEVIEGLDLPTPKTEEERRWWYSLFHEIDDLVEEARIDSLAAWDVVPGGEAGEYMRKVYHIVLDILDEISDYAWAIYRRYQSKEDKDGEDNL